MDEQGMQQIEETMQRYRAAFDEVRAADERAKTGEAELAAAGERCRAIEEELRGLFGNAPAAPEEGVEAA